MQKKSEHTINAAGKRLGRLATEIAVFLQGKNSPSYNPRLEGGVKVIVKNVSKIEVSGEKYLKKIYYKHTGYIGHLKEKTYRDIFEKDPAKVLRKSVFNMLPKNRLRAKRLRRLVMEK